MEVRITCDGASDATEWLEAIQQLLPAKSGPLGCTTLSTFEAYRTRVASAGGTGEGAPPGLTKLEEVKWRKQQAKLEQQKKKKKGGGSKGGDGEASLDLEPRWLAWQEGVLFVFNHSKEKTKRYKLAKAFPVVSSCSVLWLGFPPHGRVVAQEELKIEDVASVGKAVDGFVLSDGRDGGRGFYLSATAEGGHLQVKQWVKAIRAEQERRATQALEKESLKLQKRRNVLLKVKMATLLGAEGRHRREREDSELEARRRREEEEDEELDRLEAEEEQEALREKERAAAAASLERDKALMARVAARHNAERLEAEIVGLRSQVEEMEVKVATARAGTQKLRAEVEQEEEETARKEADVDQMVDELRTLVDGKLPRWLEHDLKKAGKAG